MHDTLLSLQREIESKMCLTGRHRKLWFLSKKRKNFSDWICFISDRRPLVSLCLFFSNNEGWIFWPSPTPVSMRILVSVHACLLFTAQHTMQQHWILTWGFTDRIVCSHGLVVRALWLLLFSQQASAAPQEKNLQKEAFSRDLSAFPQSCRSTPGVTVPEQRVQPALLCLYGKLNVLSMHLGESWNCIQSSGRDRWGSQEGCCPHMSKISGCSNTLWLK